MGKKLQRGKSTGSTDKIGGMRTLTQRVKTAKYKTKSSVKWLQRQLNDPWVALAQARGYRCRAAFKIIEIDAKFHLFTPGKKVLDLGAAPGGWSQIISQKVGSGNIIAIDLLPMDPLEGVDFIQGDFTDPQMLKILREKLQSNGGKCDVIMSDMAANTCGDKATDHLRIIGLLEQVFSFAQEVLNPQGAMVCKFFKGGSEKMLLEQMKQRFHQVKFFKPDASRAESSESYIVAMDFYD